jgi:SAM-dependent methyltransferase
MGEPAGWQERVEEFVLGQIGDPPARVLEVGCGEGELARTLARAGHSVTAIDPRAPEGTIFQRVRIEEFSDPGPFDYVVAILSLHHVEDLGKVVIELAWDQFDEATAEWVLERLPAATSSEKPSWLQRRCWGWARGGQGGTRAPAEAHFAGWAREEGFHSSRQMRGEFGRRFDEWLFEWVPHLYPDLDDDTSEADESAAIEAGTINATGIRYVGTAC